MLVFTTNAFKDDYLENPILKAAMETWKVLNCPIKIFDYDDSEVITAMSIYKKYINKAVEQRLFNFASDPIRLYILSRHKDYLYLDADVIVKNKQSNLNFLIETIAKGNSFYYRNTSSNLSDGSFAALYSGNDNYIYSDLLQKYFAYSNDLIIDKDIIAKEYKRFLNPQKQKAFQHISKVDRLSYRTYHSIYIPDINKEYDYLIKHKDYFQHFLIITSVDNITWMKEDFPLLKSIFNLDKYAPPYYKTLMPYLQKIRFDRYNYSFLDQKLN